MNRWKIAATVAALVAAGMLGSALPGSAQKSAGKGKGDSIVGYVDLAQVTERIKDTARWKQMVQGFENERNKYRNEIEELAKIRFLSSAERSELSNLKAKPRPTDGERKRIGELEERSGQFDREYATLAMQEKLTPEQDKRLKELTDLREKASGDLQGEYEKRAQLLSEKEGEMLEEMQNQILKIVVQVAEKEGVSIVIDRQAILHGGQDLTPDVLNKLPK
jgi:Skp family chaperone for outer membrane proteins